jgi:hypothetical protein
MTAPSTYDHNRQIADHLTYTLPIQTIAHLTHAGRPVSRLEHDTAFDSFVKNLQEDSHLTVGYIRGTEPSPQPHSHVAIVAAKEIPPGTIEAAWKAATGVAGALANQFDGTLGDGVGYILKCGDYSFSRNIHLFSSSTTADGLSGRELRTFTRIQQQR